MGYELGVVLVVVVMVHKTAADYSRQWAVHIEGGVDIANSIASKHGFVNLGEIFPDCYHFEHNKVAKRSLAPSLEHDGNLLNESQVKWTRQQVVRSRQKRDLLPLRQRTYRVNLNDPRWNQMWYLNRGQGLDMNVQPAWLEGVTGVGVVVTILDDGLEKDHPDLFRNYDPQASYDVNNHDEDPMPRYDLIDSNRHGTRCAGEVAATANNSLCAVGVAYGASVGGVRMLDGDVTDAVEARSLSLNPQHIDIYSASWGPDDDGKTVDGPGELATRAFIEGVTKGRSGKGSIFIWASGNGGRDHDNCNCDGYTNSIWTLSISSATENGYVPWYSEACSSTLATTYSSGASGEKQVITTDLHHQCTSGHTGTSASAPLAAGICALALEANRELTWRDMQHIVVRTARPANLKSSDWKVNGVGRNVSHSFGYGLMDAYAMVKLARSWKTVPEQHKCEVSAPHMDKLIPAKSHVSLQLLVKECAGVNFLEHVQAKVSLVSSRRGDLQIHLTSPAGTRSTLLARRPHDVSRAGFQAWPFMSVHTWGEKPFGVWQLEIHNEGRFLGRATLQEWALIFYGTAVTPDGHEGHSSHPRITSSASSPPLKPARPPPLHISPQFVVPPLKKLKHNQKNSTKIGKLTPPRTLITTTTPAYINILRVLQPTLLSTFKVRLKSTTTPTPGKTSKRPSSKAVTPLSTLVTTNASLTTQPTVTTTVSTTTAITSTSTSLTSSPNSELTILLETPSHAPPKMSVDIFKQYPKIQKVYPVYSLSKGREDPSSFHPSANLVPNLDLLQEESRRLQVEGTLSGWKMVFYGTETSPGGENHEDDDDDDIKFNDNDLMTTVDEDSQHSVVDDRQWKEVQKVETPDHTHNEVQRTTTEVDAVSASAGCLALSKKGQHCIECVEGMYLYEGRCETTCPEKYFASLNSESQPICMYCHYTCKACSGPNDYECVSCYGDAILKQTSKLEHYCYPRGILPAMETSKWFYWMFLAFMTNVTILVLILTYFLSCKLLRKYGLCKRTYEYSNVNELAKESGNQNVAYNISDSDSDT